MKIEIGGQSRGTRVLWGEDAERFDEVVSILGCSAMMLCDGRIILPSIADAECYAGSPGERMGVTGPSRETVLVPEHTDQIRRLAREYRSEFEGKVVWYFERCYRLERPQRERYREFHQLGVEWLWPKDRDAAFTTAVGEAGRMMLGAMTWANTPWKLHTDVDRGSAYYRGGTGFEIHVPALGTASQVCGGGEYEEGIGFAFGVERMVAARYGENAKGCVE